MPQIQRSLLAAAVVAAIALLAAAALPAPAAARFPGPPPVDFAAELERVAENPDELAEGERLAALFDLVWRYQMHEHPEFASMVGWPDADHGAWTDSSLAAIERRRADTRRALEALGSIDRSKLDPRDRFDYDLFRYQIEQNVAGERFPGEVLVISQLGGPQQWVPDLLSQMPRATAEHYERILERLAGVPERLEQDLVLLRRGAELGVTPPRVTLRDVADQIAVHADTDLATAPLLEPFRELPESIPAAERERLRTTAETLVRDRVAPAFERLHTYFVEEYLPATRTSIAMTDLPDGEAWYAYNVEALTTTDLTPAEIHRIGLDEVARIRAEMERVIESSGFEGTFEEFLEHLRSDERFFFDTPEELIASYREIAKRADPKLVELFGRLPRLPYGVEPVPDYAAKSQTTAYYQPGTIEAGRPGTFYANTYDLASRPKWEMEALTLHEAVPGHHLQIALAQELEDVPQFRRWSGVTAFSEGWGLYAESLGEEMGFYQDPYSKFGQLTYEMWRAIRLVVDTGMHALGWSREQAIELFEANTGKAEHDILVEVDRYIVWPGQALAYKIGELKIQELRRRAEAALGESFDIREFHDRVLGNGAVPLAVLEAEIDGWIAAEIAAAAASGERPTS